MVLQGVKQPVIESQAQLFVGEELFDVPPGSCESRFLLLVR
jgi:hypothetical protein